MSQITVTCPACGHARQVSRDSIPPRPVRATCPQCGEQFPFSGHLQELEFAFAPAAESAAEAGSGELRYRVFSFSGSAGEYFKIWIVNLLLRIVTLGLYSAWAKVRKRRYFYGNTWLDDAPFDYTGDPLAIFKGWCIGAGLFVVYSVGAQINPLLSALFGLLIFLAVPWMVVRSRMFNHYNSVLHNVRFRFQPNYREAYLVYAGLPLLIPFTLGMIVPYMIYRQKRFQVENSGYGALPFAFTATAGEFYRFFLKVGLVLLLLVAGMLGTAVVLADPLAVGGDRGAAWALLAPFGVLALFGLYFFVVVYVQTGLANLTWNATLLGEGRFVSALRTRDMAWLYLSSAVGIALSLGLLVPWAAVRLARYRCEKLMLEAPDGLVVEAGAGREVGASGEEIGDMFGVEVGL